MGGRNRLAVIAGALLAVTLIVGCTPPTGPKNGAEITEQDCSVLAKAGASPVPFSQARQLSLADPETETEDPCGPITVGLRVRLSKLTDSADWEVSCDVKSPGVAKLNLLWSSTLMMTTPPIAQCVEWVEKGADWTQLNIVDARFAQVIYAFVELQPAGADEPVRHRLDLSS